MNLHCRFALYVCIVDHKKSKEVIDVAHEQGLLGMTVLLGRGTVTKGVLGFLGLSDQERDVILFACDVSHGDQAMEVIAQELDFRKPKKGILFSIPLPKILGASLYCDVLQFKEDDYLVEHQAIYVIVEKGKAEDVIDAATKAGARGGTILNARGSGIHEQEMLFNIPIEPEKEMVLIIAKVEQVPAITQQIQTDLQLDEPGNGILFLLDVRKAIGLYGEEV